MVVKKPLNGGCVAYPRGRRLRAAGVRSWLTYEGTARSRIGAQSKSVNHTLTIVPDAMVPLFVAL